MNKALIIGVITIVTLGCSFLTAVSPTATDTSYDPIISAHRGGRNIPAYPENALETFAYTHSQVPNAWLECDISMSKDSILFILHDASLDRTTTGTGLVKKHPWSVIDTCHLVDDLQQLTPWKVPTLNEALNWAKEAEATLVLDIKRGVPIAQVLAQVEAAQVVDHCVMIVYNTEDAARVRLLNQTIRISTAIRNEEELQRHLQLGIPLDHLYAFVGTRLPAPQLLERLDSLHIPTILGSIGNLDRRAMARGNHLYCSWGQQFDVIATDHPLVVHEALQEECP